MNLFIALAPVVYIHHTPAIILQALANLDIDKIVGFLGVHEFLPTSKLLRWLLPSVCKVTPLLCESVIYLFAGLDLGDLDKSRLPVYVAHFPSGTSVKNTGHWAQGVRVDKYEMYDYGLFGNEQHYKSLSPPQYNLTSIQHPPTAIFYGKNDVLADPLDVSKLIAELPLNTVIFKQFSDKFAHLDYVWGKNAYQLVYPDVVRLMGKYNPLNQTEVKM